MPTEAQIKTLATQLATLEDPQAGVNLAVRAERARLEREAHRIAVERAKLETAALEERARALASENARTRALDEEDARLFEDAKARLIARLATHARGLFEVVEEVRALRSPRGRAANVDGVTAGLAPFIEGECGHILRSFENAHWTPSMYAAYLLRTSYEATAAPIRAAIARVEKLDAAARNGGAQ